MHTADFNHLALMDVWYEQDPGVRAQAAFPFFAGTGNEHSSVVYFEIAPEHRLADHTDSAEEIVLILAGTVEVNLGEEHGSLSAGQAALIPAMAPHGVRNIGSETARCVGFFAAAEVVSTFEQPLMPFGQHVAGTPPIAAPVN